MSKHIFSKATIRADQLIALIADRLNGNAARRCVIKQRLYLAMLASEQHHIVAARAAQKRRADAARHCSLCHWRIDYLLHAV